MKRGAGGSVRIYARPVEGCNVEDGIPTARSQDRSVPIYGPLPWSKAVDRKDECAIDPVAAIYSASEVGRLFLNSCPGP